MGIFRKSIHDRVATITIDNPTKANSMSMDMLWDLYDIMGHIAGDDTIKAVVINGVGEKYFSAGANVKQWGQLSPQDMGLQWVTDGQRIYKAVRDCNKPVIAVLNGHALGGGFELALMADYRLAVDTATVALPEPMVGTLPGWLAAEQLATMTSIAVTKSLVLFGNKLSATDAKNHGIINEVCSPNALDVTLQALLDKVMTRSTYITTLGKRLVHGAYGINRVETLHELATICAKASTAGEEGVQAFVEKRPPQFKD